MFSNLPVNKARYGLMLREDGFVMDDGTTWRLGETKFLMTTTTANAGKVMQHLEYFLDCVWPDLKVHVTSVTDQWAGAAVSGPNARKVLEACVTGTDVDTMTLPFMGIVRGSIAGLPVMICRLSFSGELAFEVYSGAGHGQKVWNELMEAGQPYDITPYGLEALGTLRIEKGHVTGAEIDGRTTAQDLHLGWMISKKKPFIGSAMMSREGLMKEGRLYAHRRSFTQRRSDFRRQPYRVSSDPNAPGASLGHVTAACYSPALGKHVALALVADGNSMFGKRAFAADPLRGRHVPVSWSRTICSIRKGGACMSDRASALGGAFVPGLYGNLAAGPGVTLSETFFDCVCELAAFDGQEPALAAMLAKAHAKVKTSCFLSGGEKPLARCRDT